MHNRLSFSLALCLCCALLLAACSSETSNTGNTSTTNSAAKTTTNSTTTTTSSPATTTSSPATTTSPAATTASTGEKIGVAECDEYLDKYEACVSGKVPAAQRAQYESSLAQARKSWRDLAANPQTKATLAQVCKMATEQAKQALSSYGCNF